MNNKTKIIFIFLTLLVFDVLFLLKIRGIKYYKYLGVEVDLHEYCEPDKMCNKKIGYFIAKDKQVYLTINKINTSDDTSKGELYLKLNNTSVLVDTRVTLDKLFLYKDAFLLVIGHDDDSTIVKIYDISAKSIYEYANLRGKLGEENLSISNNEITLNRKEEDVKEEYGDDCDVKHRYLIYYENYYIEHVDQEY